MHLARRWFTGLGFDQEIPHTRHLPRTASGFSNRSCSKRCLNRSCGSVWKWDW